VVARNFEPINCHELIPSSETGRDGQFPLATISLLLIPFLSDTFIETIPTLSIHSTTISVAFKMSIPAYSDIAKSSSDVSIVVVVVVGLGY
jgi:hypothetical protein